ncbi:unnamed protein product, partial [Amoebophrya sp. A120]
GLVGAAGGPPVHHPRSIFSSTNTDYSTEEEEKLHRTVSHLDQRKKLCSFVSTSSRTRAAVVPQKSLHGATGRGETVLERNTSLGATALLHPQHAGDVDEVEVIHPDRNNPTIASFAPPTA